MKAILITLALLFAASLSAKANTTVVIDETVAAVAAQADEFVVVKFEELKAEVQTAINAELTKQTLTIKEVSTNKANNDIKVVATNAQNAEVVLNFDAQGKLKAEVPAAK
jgi:polyisoprenoid-binding protein YceI